MNVNRTRNAIVIGLLCCVQACGSSTPENRSNTDATNGQNGINHTSNNNPTQQAGGIDAEILSQNEQIFHCMLEIWKEMVQEKTTRDELTPALQKIHVLTAKKNKKDLINCTEKEKKLLLEVRKNFFRPQACANTESLQHSNNLLSSSRQKISDLQQQSPKCAALQIDDVVLELYQKDKHKHIWVSFF